MKSNVILHSTLLLLIIFASDDGALKTHCLHVPIDAQDTVML